MLTGMDRHAHEAALRHPAAALESLGVTRHTTRNELAAIFAKAWVSVNAGSPENHLCRDAVCKAVSRWHDQKDDERDIPRWLAQACVNTQKSSS
jgi:DNA-binding FadR family transcriptional regulator